MENEIVFCGDFSEEEAGTLKDFMGKHGFSNENIKFEANPRKVEINESFDNLVPILMDMYCVDGDEDELRKKLDHYRKEIIDYVYENEDSLMEMETFLCDVAWGHLSKILDEKGKN